MWLYNVQNALITLNIWQGFLMFLVNIDKLGNALCGGDYRATISGRVGHFAHNKRNPYWKLLQYIINFTFMPIDGPEHCYTAWRGERRNNYRRSSDIALAALSIVVMVSCLIIAPCTYGYALFYRIKYGV